MGIENFNMKQRMEHYQVKGVSVSIIKEDTIQKTLSYGVKNSETNSLIDQDSIFNACSMSKFATALLAMKLVSDGILDLDQDINTLLTSWKLDDNQFTENHKVTLRNLLCHQAGLIDPEGSFGEYDQVVGKPSMMQLLEGKTIYYPKRAEVEYVPNSDCVYSDIGYCLIELLITDVTGKNFIELMEQEILNPLNMNHSKIIDIPLDQVDSHFTSGHTQKGDVIDMKKSVYPYPAAAGLWSTSNDLAILLIEVFNLLKGNGTLNISQSTIHEMVKPQGCKPWSGLGVFLDTVETNLELASFGWGIGYQCMFIGYPTAGSGAVIMTNTDTGMHQLKGLIGECIHALEL